MNKPIQKRRFNRLHGAGVAISDDDDGDDDTPMYVVFAKFFHSIVEQLHRLRFVYYCK